MRQIKFRGVDVETGNVVYGDLTHCEDDLCITSLIGDDTTLTVRIKPDSVRQLVGIDSKGREVYEGDVVFAREKEMHALLVPMPHPRDALLKENQHETVPLAVED